jgi:hypothetical protein
MRHKGVSMQLRFRYLVEDVDRHGNIRLYVRVPGRPKVRIREPFGTDEFIAASCSVGSRDGPAAGAPSPTWIIPALMRAVLR